MVGAGQKGGFGKGGLGMYPLFPLGGPLGGVATQKQGKRKTKKKALFSFFLVFLAVGTVGWFFWRANNPPPKAWKRLLKIA